MRRKRGFHLDRNVRTLDKIQYNFMLKLVGRDKFDLKKKNFFFFPRLEISVVTLNSIKSATV